MNSSKLQKRREKYEYDNVKVSDNEEYTMYETNAFVLAIPVSSNYSATKEGKLSTQMKRKLGYMCISSKKKKTLLEESSKVTKYNCDIINSKHENEFKCTNTLTFKNDNKTPKIHTKNEVGDKSGNNARSENSCDGNAPEYDDDANDFIDEQESFRSINNTDDVYNKLDDEEDENFQNKLINSDLQLSDDSIGPKVDSGLSEEYSESECNIGEHDLRYQYSVLNMQNYILNFYKIKDEKKYILHLPCHKKFHFQGKIQITLLYGAIEIFGYKLNHLNENKTLQLYSPRRCMQLGISSQSSRTVQDPIHLEEMIKENFNISENDFEKLTHSFNSNDALILVERLFSTCTLMLDHYCDIDFFLHKEIIQKHECIEKDLDCILDTISAFERKGFTEGEDWNRIVPKNCTLICGGKGVGKSTLLKFLINSELTCKEAVLCIDLDPGQTEFTTPGCVSAVLIKKPLFGPNFMNVTTPRKMAFIGVVNVALDPVRYMNAVNYIVASCREDPELSSIPWFVNTMGFNKGIGLDIIVNIIKFLKPDGVVQINSSDKSRNYDIILNPAAVQRFAVLSLLPVEDQSLNYTVYILKSCSRSRGVGFQSGFRPAELREFMILSYFSPLLSLPYCSLNAVQPVWIHFSKISIAVNGLVQLNYILKAINGNLVALCNIDGVKCTTKSVATLNSNNSFLKVAIQPEIAPCFGIGLVRGIDCNEEKIYIITPLSNEELEKVNCLYLGNINTPSSFYLKQKYVNVPAVYTDIRGTNNVRSVRQSFRYIPDFKKHESE